MEKAKNNEALIWDRWSCSSEPIQESRSNATMSKGLYRMRIGKELQVQKTMILLLWHNPKGLYCKELYENRVSFKVL